MTLDPIVALVQEVRTEADLLEQNGVNVVPLRRFADRLEARLEAVKHGASYITPLEYGRRRGVSDETVRQWCAAGKVPGAIRVGSRWKIPSRVA